MRIGNWAKNSEELWINYDYITGKTTMLLIGKKHTPPVEYVLIRSVVTKGGDTSHAVLYQSPNKEDLTEKAVRYMKLYTAG